MDLINSVEDNDIELVKQLIVGGANVNFVNDYGRTALHYASLYGFAEYCKLLIDANADIHKGDYYGVTPLHWSTKHLE